MSSVIGPEFRQAFEHSACNGFCICQECKTCWLKPYEHSQAECRALQSFWRYAPIKTEHCVGVRACTSSCWCSACGACWSLDSYHKGQACPFYTQVGNMKATMAYIGNKNKRTLTEASPTSKGSPGLALNEQSPSEPVPEHSHHNATEPASPPGLDRKLPQIIAKTSI